jgi:uncharacterized protein YbjT (DUF2867 family)
MVRDPAGARAQALAERGIDLVRGDFDHADSLAPAVGGVDSVFAVTTPMAGIATEVRHGKAIVDAAEKAGVGHFVFSSVAGADQRTGIPHFDSKYDIEVYLRERDIPWTITAPAYFYDNAVFPWNLGDLKQGRFRQAMKPSLELQQVSVRDIGRFNALVLERRDPFIGERIDFAADQVTGADMAAAIGAASGRSIEYVEQSLDEVRAQFADMAIMYEWFDRVGFSADVPGLRSSYPEVDWLTFEQWSQTQDWTRVLA